MSKRTIFTLGTLVVIGAAAAGAVLLVKGYTFSPQQGKVVGTGLISVTSVPDGASVYVDNHLTTATNTTISQLQPKTYSIKIVKEGFIPWEKQIEVKEGLVSEIKATLFPALPTIYPLTFNGVISPVLSPDGQKLAFVVPFNNDNHARQKGGVWVWTFGSQPLSFSRDAEPHQIVASTSTLDFAKATLRWTPDGKQLLVTLQEGDQTTDASKRNYLLPFDRLTSLADLRDITPMIESNLKGWEDDQKTKDEARILTIIDQKLRQIASDSATLHWSPDETKFLVGGKLDDGKLKVGKLPPAKVYDVATGKAYDLPQALDYFWLPDSRHIILVQEDKVSVSEFDGNNVAVIYAGKFEADGVFPWSDSSRLVILTSFNTPTASKPNLFGINLK